MRIEDATIIIPYSGDYTYLKLCLKIGLARQELKPKHIIIIFDNCNLDIEEYPDKYAVSDMDAQVFSYSDQEGAGNRAAVRNCGIRAVKTEWLFLLDEDIVLFPSYFTELQRVASSIPLNHVIHGSLINRKVETTLPLEEIIKMTEDPGKVTDKHRQAASTISPNRWMSFCTGNLLVSKKLMVDAGLFDEKIKGWGEEDTEMGFRVYKAGGQFFNMLCLRGFHLARSGINRRSRNKGWSKNLEYTLAKHKGTEYVKQRSSSLSFARRYS